MTHTGIGTMLVSSRSFDEYVAMFALDEQDLATSSILDCPAGTSSFAAVARERGTRVTACDTAYDNLRGLVNNAQAEVLRGNQFIAANPDAYTDAFFRNAEHHREHRLIAVTRFIDDLGKFPGSYVHACLPELPFADQQFDLVLSSHLLFSYADRLDFGSHYTYLTELMRVARVEVRVFPLTPMGSERHYPHLAEVRRRLEDADIATSIVPVSYEFQRGGTEMLVCRRD